MAQVGRPAPLFEIEGVNEKGDFIQYRLSEYKGKWVVLFFYPLDFTFICPTEITGFSKRYDEFEKLNAVVFGCSTDSVHSHKAWLKDLGELRFPLLSDMNHSTSRDYGVLLAEQGVTLRGTFIIDPDGILRLAIYHDMGVGRSVSELLRVLSALQTGELCPVEWKPGEKTLGKS
ncbi:TPA: thioredoxin peroxidase [Candidatus Uhrbacteria bacterium]|nr:thioredoxin peroxidase [Candidatus Uhrbacteria bacterium]